MKLRKIKKYSSFRKFRLIVLGLAFFLFVSYTISYAVFNQTLDENGNVTVLLDDSDILVTEIKFDHKHKNATNLGTSKSGNTATINAQLSQTVGRLHYIITIQNVGDSNARFVRVDEETNNDTIRYSLEASDPQCDAVLDTSVILAPGESITFDFVIRYKEAYKYSLPSNTSINATYTFVFEPTLRNPLIPITGNIVEDSGNVNDNELGARATVNLRNDNDFDVDVVLSTYRSFVIYDKNGKVLGTERKFHLGANSQAQFITYIDETDSSISSSGTETDLVVIAIIEEYGTSKTSVIDTINLTLNDAGKYKLLEDGFTVLKANDDFFSTVETGTGKIYETTGQDGKYTYFYRGAFNDNYFSFGGYLWRILRIDENANIRLILEGVIEDSNGRVVTQVFKTSSTATSMDAAKLLVKLINDKNNTDTSGVTGNSPVYGYLGDQSTTTLRGWYNNNLSQYEKYIVDSNFCQDTENGTANSSAAGHTVSYFGPYQKTDHDTELYDPLFSCPSDDIVVEKVGLLSIDEYVFAGGAAEATNSSFFLNDNGILNNARDTNGNSVTTWWTMSPSYYDSQLQTAGVFYIMSTGKFMDWYSNEILNNAMAIRPVITLKGTFPITGDGTKDAPYEIEDYTRNYG